jgi:AcrR family transcriptional regulator
MPPKMGGLESEVLVEAPIRPRARILKAAQELFYHHGVHVGVDAIAAAAGTNSTTLYRHFKSKDELIAECLRECGREFEVAWEVTERAHRDDPKGQLLAWLRVLADYKLGSQERGCALANAAVELPDSHHPARRVVEKLKGLHRGRIITLCRQAGLRDPELLADELFLLCEGARVSIQSVGPTGPAARLADMLDALVAAHATAGQRHSPPVASVPT